MTLPSRATQAPARQRSHHRSRPHRTKRSGSELSAGRSEIAVFCSGGSGLLLKAGVRGRWVHRRGQHVRRGGRRVLRRRLTEVRRPNANGFTPTVRNPLFGECRALEIKECPFVNLPEAKSGRWGVGLTAAKLKDCRWLKPLLVAQIDFLEWTPDNHLRHTQFVALRDDKTASQIKRE